MGALAIDRRKLLGALALAPAVAAMPALAAAGPSPFRVAQARYRAAEARFNALPDDLEETDRAEWIREQHVLFATCRDAEAAPVADWHEFADQFAIACDDGQSLLMEDTMFKLFADAQRLAKASPRQ